MRWGGTTIFGGTGGKYVQTFDGGGGSRDFQMPQNSPLIFSEGRAEFERHALDIDPHPTQRVVRGSGDRTVVDHSFLLRHHRYANMYVQPLGCSATSGGLTCQDLSQPLIEARVGSDGAQMLARHAGVTFDPVTGQRIFDFNVRAIRDDVVRVLRPRISRRQQEAWEAYLEGLRLDEDETTRHRAETAYRRAVELDPNLATALTNLGNLRLLAGDRAEAEALYRRAMGADTTLAEAPYNLAYLLVERGEHAQAVELFRRAVELRADFAEAHFNLAMALSELGRRVEARVHWKKYLELEPQGTWSSAARQHLDG